jgi:hypothetical protein
MRPGELVRLRENPNYSGIVINRELMKDCYKDSANSEPHYLLVVLWSVECIPHDERGSLGNGAGLIKTILEDLVEVQSLED